MQVLQGAKNILSKRPKLAIEVHTELLPQYGASLEGILSLIGVENYRVWIQWKDDQQPEKFDVGTPIASRVHLFFVPIASRQLPSGVPLVPGDPRVSLVGRCGGGGGTGAASGSTPCGALPVERARTGLAGERGQARDGAGQHGRGSFARNADGGTGGPCGLSGRASAAFPSAPVGRGLRRPDSVTCPTRGARSLRSSCPCRPGGVDQDPGRSRDTPDQTPSAGPRWCW